MDCKKKKKKIDIEFVDGDEPCILTCSYSVTLPATNAVKMLEMALKYVGDLGTIKQVTQDQQINELL